MEELKRVAKEDAEEAEKERLQHLADMKTKIAKEKEEHAQFCSMELETMEADHKDEEKKVQEAHNWDMEEKERLAEEEAEKKEAERKTEAENWSK